MNVIENKRLPYIDALRGLAMFSVVVGHVWLHTGSCYNPFFQLFNVALQLPLFFFISGFLYKKYNSWFQLIKSKFCYLVIPALIFLALFCLSEQQSFIGAIKHDFKYGYWFTLSLFEFLVIYSFLDILIHKRNLKLQTSITLHLLIAVSIYYLSFHCKWIGRMWFNLFSIELTKYYLFFVLGVTIKTIISNIKSTPPIYKELILNTIGCGYLLSLTFYLYGQYAKYSWIYGSTPILLLSLSSVAFFVVYFKRSKSIKKRSTISKCLVYIGKHSLDVYFIHYFLLPNNLTFINKLFIIYPSSIFEYLLCALIGSVIVIVSLLIGNMIRTIPILSKWMLGANPRQNRIPKENI